MVKSRFLLSCGLLLAPCFTGSASQIGSFTAVGTISVSSAGVISWSLTGIPNEFLVQSSDGIYTGISPINTILNLTNGPGNSGPDIVGAPGFPNQLFIQFTGGLAPDLLINFIQQGVDGTADCALAPAVGQTCTPLIAPGVAGPFNFQNLDSGTGLITSSASFVFSGVDTAGNVWSATFTSQFGVPFQAVLNQLATTGSVTNSYSQLTITLGTVPEPGPLSTMSLGLGLLVVGFSVRKFRSRLRS